MKTEIFKTLLNEAEINHSGFENEYEISHPLNEDFFIRYDVIECVCTFEAPDANFTNAQRLEITHKIDDYFREEQQQEKDAWSNAYSEQKTNESLHKTER